MRIQKRNYTKIRLLLMIVICVAFVGAGMTLSFAAVGDIPTKSWDKLVGGTSGDLLKDVTESTTDRFTSVGESTVYRGNVDGMIVNTDERGTVKWTRFLGGSTNDRLEAVATMADGTLLVAGSSASSRSGNITDQSNGEYDGLLAKYTAEGTKVWDKLVGGSQSDLFYDVIPTSDGGFLAVGSSKSSASGEIRDTKNGESGSSTMDGYIVKFNAAGNIQWDNLFGSFQSDVFNSVVQTSDGGYVVAGYAACEQQTPDPANSLTTGEITDPITTSSVMPHEALLVKFNSSGAMVWNNLFGSTSYDDFYGLTATSDGGFVAVGRTAALDGDITTGEVSGNATALIAKFGSNGQNQWHRAFTLGGVPTLYDVVQQTDGSYTVAGVLFEGTGGQGLNDGVLARIGSVGTVLDHYVIGGSEYDYLYGLATTDDGNVMVAGESNNAYTDGTILDKTNGNDDGLLAFFAGEVFSYNVDFDTAGGPGISGQTLSFGGWATRPEDPVWTGHTFEGWYADENYSEPFPFEERILEDMTIYGKWNINKYLLSFEENGGTQIPDQTIEYGGLMTDPGAPVRAGYTFQGWCANPELTEGISYLTPIEEDTTYYAKWYVHVMIDPIAADDSAITGVGQPYFLITVTLPDGKKFETTVLEDGTWRVGIPKSSTLHGGDKIRVDMYDIFGDGVLVSSDEEVVAAVIAPPVVDPPETGDRGNAILLTLLGMLLGLMIGIGVLKGPKRYR